MPLDQDVALGILLEELRELVDAPLPAGRHLRSAGGEEHVAHREDDAPIGLLSLEVRQLLREGGRLGLLGLTSFHLGLRLSPCLFGLRTSLFGLASFRLRIPGASLGRYPSL